VKTRNRSAEFVAQAQSREDGAPSAWNAWKRTANVKPRSRLNRDAGFKYQTRFTVICSNGEGGVRAGLSENVD